MACDGTALPAPSVSCSWRHLDAAESEKATVRRADWSCMDMCDRSVSGRPQKSMLGLRAMHGAIGGRARTFRWARGAEPCCAAHEKVSRQPSPATRGAQQGVAHCGSAIAAQPRRGGSQTRTVVAGIHRARCEKRCPGVRHGTVVYNRGVKWGPADPAWRNTRRLRGRTWRAAVRIGLGEA